MAKASQPPAACNPDALDTWSTLKLVVSTTVFGYADPCDEYHRALLTDPTYEISPFLALVDMLATGIFHPLKYIGEQFGGFFDGVLSESSCRSFVLKITHQLFFYRFHRVLYKDPRILSSISNYLVLISLTLRLRISHSAVENHEY